MDGQAVRQAGRQTDERMDGHIDGEGSARDRHALVQHAAHSRNHTAHSTKQHINAAHGFQRAACSHQCANHARYFQKQKK